MVIGRTTRHYLSYRVNIFEKETVHNYCCWINGFLNSFQSCYLFLLSRLVAFVRVIFWVEQWNPGYVWCQNSPTTQVNLKFNISPFSSSIGLNIACHPSTYTWGFPRVELQKQVTIMVPFLIKALKSGRGGGGEKTHLWLLSWLSWEDIIICCRGESRGESCLSPGEPHSWIWIRFFDRSTTPGTGRLLDNNGEQLVSVTNNDRKMTVQIYISSQKIGVAPNNSPWCRTRKEKDMKFNILPVGWSQGQALLSPTSL